MKGILNLIAGIIAVLNIVWHLMRNPGGAESIFGFEINGYLYLGIWVFVAFTCLGQFYKQNKGKGSKEA